MKKLILILILSIIFFNSYCQNGNGIYYLAKNLRELYNSDTKKIPFDDPIKTGLENSVYHGSNVDLALLNKNPFFENRLKLSENNLAVSTIEGVLNLDEEIKSNTKVGLVRGLLANDDEIEEKLNAIPMAEFFKVLESEVSAYYK